MYRAVAILILLAAVVWGLIEFNRPPRKKSRPSVPDARAIQDSERVAPLHFQSYGTFNDPHLTEVSGLVASRRHRGVYWALNDSGNSAEIFAVDDHGKLLSAWPIAGATNLDWEDIAVDDDGRIIIADTGTDGRGQGIWLLQEVEEPADLSVPSALPVKRTRPFRFPDPKRDCEAMFAWRGERYVFEKKGTVEKPARRPVKLFRVPAVDAGDATAAPELDHIESFTFRAPVTAADISRDGRQLAVLTSTALYIFERRDVEGRFLMPDPRVIPFQFDRAESVAFHHDGVGDVLVATEGRSIYRVSPR